MSVDGNFYVVYVNDHNESGYFTSDNRLDAISDLNEIKNFCRTVKILDYTSGNIIKEYMKKSKKKIDEKIRAKDISKPGESPYYVFNDKGWRNKILVGRSNVAGMLQKMNQWGYEGKYDSHKNIEFYDNGKHFATFYNERVAGEPTLEHDGTVDDTSFKRSKSKRESVNEGTVAGAVGADDGPSFMYPSHETYVRASTKDLKKYIETGWTIVSHMMDDETEEDIMARIYPDGPVGAVSFFPAGDVDNPTPTNQEDLFGMEAYDKWKKHTLDTIAKVGWEWIRRRDDDDDVKAAVKDAEGSKKVSDDEKKEKEEFKKKIEETVQLIETSVELLAEAREKVRKWEYYRNPETHWEYFKDVGSKKMIGLNSMEKNWFKLENSSGDEVSVWSEGFTSLEIHIKGNGISEKFRDPKKAVDFLNKNKFFNITSDGNDAFKIPSYMKESKRVEESGKINKSDLNFLKDQLSNSMEYYDKQSFVDHINRETGIDKEKLRKMYDAYWDIPARDRMEFGLSKGWDKWLKNFDLKESIDEARFDSNTEFEKLAKQFQKDTGMLAPGKDDRSGLHSREERMKAWDRWLKKNELNERTLHRPTKDELKRVKQGASIVVNWNGQGKMAYKVLSKNDKELKLKGFDGKKYKLSYDMYDSVDKIRESVNEALSSDLKFLIDQLANSMEYYDKKEFMNHMSKETKYDKKVLGQVFDSYWEGDPRKYLRFATKDWHIWLMYNVDEFKRWESVNEARKARKDWWKKADKKKLPKIQSKEKDDFAGGWVVQIERPDVKRKTLIGQGKTQKDAYADALSKASQEMVDLWLKESVNEANIQDLVGKTIWSPDKSMAHGKITNVKKHSADNVKVTIKDGGTSVTKSWTEREVDALLNKGKADVKRMGSVKIVNEAASKSFSKSAEKYQIESFKLQELKDAQKKVVETFKQASPDQKKRLKKDLIRLHREVKKQQSKVDKAEKEFESAIKNEPEELEELVERLSLSAKNPKQREAILSLLPVDLDHLSQYKSEFIGMLNKFYKQHGIPAEITEDAINESVGVMKKEGDTYYVDTDFVQNSQKAGTLKHISMGDFELRVDGGGTVEFNRASKKFPSFSGRAHKVKGSEDDIKKILKKMPKGVTQESVNEYGSDLGVFTGKEDELERQVKARAQSIGKKKLTDKDIDTWLRSMGNLNNYGKDTIKNLKKAITKVNESMINETKFYAWYNRKKIEVDGKDLWDAKKKAIKKLNVPKKDHGLVAVKSVDAMEKGDFRYESLNEASGDYVVLSLKNDGKGGAVVTSKTDKKSAEEYAKKFSAGRGESHHVAAVSDAKKLARKIPLIGKDVLDETSKKDLYNARVRVTKGRKEFEGDVVKMSGGKVKIDLGNNKYVKVPVDDVEIIDESLNESRIELGAVYGSLDKQGDGSKAGHKMQILRKRSDGTYKVKHWFARSGKTMTKYHDRKEVEKWIKKLEELNINEAVRPSDTIENLKDIVKNKQMAKVDGTKIDTTTAGAIVQMYDKVSDKVKKKLNNATAAELANVVWKFKKGR